MQGIGGFNNNLYDFTILRSCDEISNKDTINFNGDIILWENFKLNKFPNWNFDS